MFSILLPDDHFALFKPGSGNHWGAAVQGECLREAVVDHAVTLRWWAGVCPFDID